MRVLNLVMAALFIFGALVQINDPDPFGWMAIYVAAGVASYLAIKRPTEVVLPAIVGGVALGWAVLLATGATVPIFDLFEQWEMRDTAVEVSREFYGLGFIALWMMVLIGRAVALRRNRPAAA